MDVQAITEILRERISPVIRWSGAIAKGLRAHNIALAGKESGSSNTDALTLADLTVQELLVDALRDADPLLRQCKIAAEESTGDLDRFATQSELTICLDPIDGTKQFRDRNGEGWSVMLHVQDHDRVRYSLVYLPGLDDMGRWVETSDEGIRCGADDWTRSANEVLHQMPLWTSPPKAGAKKVYLIGFQDHDPAKAELVTQAGLEGVVADETPGSVYDLMATGDFAGSLIHTPNIYDFPVSSHIARVYGGDSVWVDSGKPVHFRDTWMDERADMLRIPGIVATSAEPSHLKTLCDLAKDWNPIRYAE